MATESAAEVVGLRRRPRIDGPGRDLTEALRGFGITDIADAMHQVGAMDGGIVPAYRPSPRFIGAAVTVVVPTGAQEVRRAAIETARDGDVLVISALGVSSYAVLGGNLARAIQERGIAAVVIDGCVRDVSEIQSVGMPVFCRGRSIASAPKTGNGEVNVPVACGGVVVEPGDLVAGDDDGVVVVPRNAAAQVLAAVEQRQAADSRSGQ